MAPHESRALFAKGGFTCAAALILSLFLIPWDSYLLICSYVLQLLGVSHGTQVRRKARLRPDFVQRVVLITGVDEPKGLFLARSLYEAGHVVIGVGFESLPFTGCGRFSRSVHRYLVIAPPDAINGPALYIKTLEMLISDEKIDLWIPCSGSPSLIHEAQAAEVVTRRTACSAMHLGAEASTLLHDPEAFMSQLRSLGLPALETTTVTSRHMVHKILGAAGKKRQQFVIKGPQVETGDRVRVPLPRRTLSQTYAHVSQLAISPASPRVLQEYVDGTSYTAQALIVHGVIVGFAAWNPGPGNAYRQMVPAASALSQSMLKYMQEFLARSRTTSCGWLGFEFRAKEKTSVTGPAQLLFAIRADTQAHDAATLFWGLEPEIAAAHLKALDMLQAGSVGEGHGPAVVMPRQGPYKMSLAQDYLLPVVVPTLQFTQAAASAPEAFRTWKSFLNHCGLSYDLPIFKVWDPLPWWIRNHIQLPVAAVQALWRRHGRSVKSAS